MVVLLLAEFLASGLEKLVGLVVSNSPSTLVDERQSLDGVLIVNEAINTKLKNDFDKEKRLSIMLLGLIW